LPEICPWLQHSLETARHSLPCIAMQARQNYQGRFSGFGQRESAGNALFAAEWR
jgi:hypothetical protein